MLQICIFLLSHGSNWEPWFLLLLQKIFWSWRRNARKFTLLQHSGLSCLPSCISFSYLLSHARLLFTPYHFYLYCTLMLSCTTEKILWAPLVTRQWIKRVCFSLPVLENCVDEKDHGRLTILRDYSGGLLGLVLSFLFEDHLILFEATILVFSYFF